MFIHIYIDIVALALCVIPHRLDPKALVSGRVNATSSKKYIDVSMYIYRCRSSIPLCHPTPSRPEGTGVRAGYCYNIKKYRCRDVYICRFRSIMTILKHQFFQPLSANIGSILAAHW